MNNYQEQREVRIKYQQLRKLREFVRINNLRIETLRKAKPCDENMLEISRLQSANYILNIKIQHLEKGSSK